VIVSDTDHYLFTKGSQTVHVNGNPVAGADPASFQYWSDGRMLSADPAHFEMIRRTSNSLTATSPRTAAL
jgi:hypothetical protein